MSSVLPPKYPEGELMTLTLRVPGGIVKQIDEIAKESDYSRNEVMIHFLRWASQQHKTESAEKRPRNR